MEIINRIISFFFPQKNIKSKQSTSVVPEKVVIAKEVSRTPLWSAQNRDLYTQLEDKYYQYFIGVSSLLDENLNPFEIKVIELLEKTVKQDHSLAKDIPRLPGVVPKLLHLLRKDDFNWKEISDLIASDPVVLVEVIKLANSSAYNLNAKIEHLEHVLVQLGLLEVRVAIMKVSLKPIMIFEGGHFLKHSGTKIWDHAVNTAVASRTLAEIYKCDAFDAYLAGLLNYMGMVIVVKKMNAVKDFKEAPRSIQFQKKLMRLAKELSIKIAQNWEMQPSIISALTEQLESNTKQIKSTLGDVVYEGTTVSMEYILGNNNLWEKREETDDEEQDIPYYKAYEELDLMNK